MPHLQPDKPDRQVVNKSLGKALQLLSAFSEGKADWSVSELSRHLGIGKSSVSTMLGTLAQTGLVRQSPMTRRYQLGLRCLELGYLASSRLALRDYAYPYLEELLGANNRIVYLAVPYQDDMLYLEALYPPRRKINYSSQGKRAPMYCTGIGKAALAFLPEAYQEDYLRRVALKPLTPNTISEPAALQQELRQIREQGYAVDRQERDLGIRCVAAPIRVADGQLVAAISISGASSEVAEEAFPALALEVMRAALDISRKLISAGGSSLAL